MITPTTSTSTTSTAASTDWRHRAVCADLAVDPELFFPIGETGPALLQTQQAKAVCRRCPVIEDCLEWAMETHQVHGVWGGASEGERGAARRRAYRQAASARNAA